jgi:hypothetical protein
MGKNICNLGMGLSEPPPLFFFKKMSGSATDCGRSMKSYGLMQSQVWQKKDGDGVKSATAGILRYVIFEQICVASSCTQIGTLRMPITNCLPCPINEFEI